MAKKATSFMRERGFIKVWNSRQKKGGTRQAWSDGRILVWDGLPWDFDLPVGSYVYEDGIIKPGKIPNFKELIPKQKGYHKADIVTDTEYNLLRLLKRDSLLLVTLKAKGIKAYLRYDYYQYITEKSYEAGIWKIKTKIDPILYLIDKSISVVVMPYKLHTD